MIILQSGCRLLKTRSKRTMVRKVLRYFVEHGIMAWAEFARGRITFRCRCFRTAPTPSTEFACSPIQDRKTADERVAMLKRRCGVTDASGCRFKLVFKRVGVWYSLHESCGDHNHPLRYSAAGVVRRLHPTDYACIARAHANRMNARQITTALRKMGRTVFTPSIRRAVDDLRVELMLEGETDIDAVIRRLEQDPLYEVKTEENAATGQVSVISATTKFAQLEMQRWHRVFFMDSTYKVHK